MPASSALTVEVSLVVEFAIMAICAAARPFTAWPDPCPKKPGLPDDRPIRRWLFDDHKKHSIAGIGQ
jgi:hypothetical protein